MLQTSFQLRKLDLPSDWKSECSHLKVGDIVELVQDIAEKKVRAGKAKVQKVNKDGENESCLLADLEWYVLDFNMPNPPLVFGVDSLILLHDRSEDPPTVQPFSGAKRGCLHFDVFEEDPAIIDVLSNRHSSSATPTIAASSSTATVAASSSSEPNAEPEQDTAQSSCDTECVEPPKKKKKKADDENDDLYQELLRENIELRKRLLEANKALDLHRIVLAKVNKSVNEMVHVQTQHPDVLPANSLSVTHEETTTILSGSFIQQLYATTIKSERLEMLAQHLFSKHCWELDDDEKKTLVNTLLEVMKPSNRKEEKSKLYNLLRTIKCNKGGSSSSE